MIHCHRENAPLGQSDSSVVLVAVCFSAAHSVFFVSLIRLFVISLTLLFLLSLSLFDAHCPSVVNLAASYFSLPLMLLLLNALSFHVVSFFTHLFFSLLLSFSLPLCLSLPLYHFYVIISPVLTHLYSSRQLDSTSSSSSPASGLFLRICRSLFFYFIASSTLSLSLSSLTTCVTATFFAHQYVALLLSLDIRASFSLSRYLMCTTMVV